ncbi:MAG: DUF4192 domain-containing protein [Sciscionella sp.]
MTTPTRTPIRLTDPGELLAAVPHLLGFHPTNSVVLITLCGRTANRIGMALRTDLPPPQDNLALAAQLRGPVLANRATGVCVAVIGGAEPAPGSTDPPCRDLVDAIEETLWRCGVPVAHAVWTPELRPGQHWRCYDDPRCHGVLADPTGSVLAAATVAAGVVTYGSRQEVAAQLSGVDEQVLVKRAAMLDEAAGRAERPGAERAGSESRSALADLELLRDAIREAAAGRLPHDDADIVRLALALGDHRVRDACLVCADQEEAAAAQRLWTELTRGTPAPERAEPACLLAFAAYREGNGALAGVALEAAEQADPGHQLSWILREVLDLGVPPSRLSDVAEIAAAEAAELLSE